jgi:hypothetical protein
MKFFAPAQHLQNHLHTFFAGFQLLRRLQAIHNGVNIRFIERFKNALAFLARRCVVIHFKNFFWLLTYDEEADILSETRIRIRHDLGPPKDRR